MFSRAAAKSLTTVARRRAATTSAGVAKNGSKKFRALSDIAAEAPKDIPPTTSSAGKHWRAEGQRRCHGHGKKVAGKVLAFGLVGYGGYWYGSQCKAAAPPTFAAAEKQQGIAEEPAKLASSVLEQRNQADSGSSSSK